MSIHVRHPIDTSLAGRIRGGETVHGIFNSIPSPAIVEMCAYAGFDFIVLDNEHGSADLLTTEHLLRAARAAGIPAIVRCFEADIPRILDMGASGVQVPMVETAEQAHRLACKLRYPTPLPGGGVSSGTRGSAFSGRAAGYGAFGGPGHTKLSNEGLLLIAMVESPTGVENVAAIAATPGLDAVFVGPNDLAHTMGCENRWQEAAVQQAMERVMRVVQAAGKCAGILALDPDEEARYAKWGARYFASVSTSVITRALRDAARGASPSISY